MAKKEVKEEIKNEEIKEDFNSSEEVAEENTSEKDGVALDKDSESNEEEVQVNEDEKDDVSAEIENLKASNLRLNAEFQNYRKRVEKEKADIYKFANEKLMMDILPVVDDFERAIESFVSIEVNDGFTSGIEMIKKSLDEFMKKNSVEAIDAVGKPFDPNFHHAVMSEDSGEFEEETVIAEFQKGYTLNGKVIRPSMVKVSK